MLGIVGTTANSRRWTDETDVDKIGLAENTVVLRQQRTTNVPPYGRSSRQRNKFEPELLGGANGSILKHEGLNRNLGTVSVNELSRPCSLPKH